MKEDTRLWIWVGAASGVVIFCLLLWWWSENQANNVPLLTYDAGSPIDSLKSPNVPTPTAPISVAKPIPRKNKSVPQDTSVLGVIGGLKDASKFAALLNKSGVAAELKGEGPYTVFAPTNTSFSLLPPGSLSLSEVELRRLMQYHVVSGKRIDVNGQVAGTVDALSQDMLNFSLLQADQSARINSAVALSAYQADNGIVYVISEVLLPPLGR